MKKIAWSKYLVFALATSLVLTAASCRPSATTTPSESEDGRIDTTTPITLEYWRLFDDSGIFDDYIKDYQREHPNITIEVKKIDTSGTYGVYEYQRDIIKLIADDAGGPDIFMMHNSWLPYQKNQIVPIPNEMMTVKDYRNTYPKVVQDDFIDNNRIYAVPYFVDNLMLYYNEEIFYEKRIKQPPKTWHELVEMVPRLTERSATGQLITSAIPLGGSLEGMPRGADILTTLMMQYGAEMTSADRTTATFDLPAPDVQPALFAGSEALAFYTQFADPESPLYTYTDAKQPNGQRAFPSDIQAFLEDKAAMYIGYAYQVNNIRKTNPKLKFKTAPLPQLHIQSPVNIAHYWAETVSKTSKHKNEAWDFIKFMAERKNQNRYFQDAKAVPARLDVLENLASRRDFGPIAAQAEFSKSWYRKNTADVEQVFHRMITSVVNGEVDPKIAVDVAVRDINALK